MTKQRYLALAMFLALGLVAVSSFGDAMTTIPDPASDLPGWFQTLISLGKSHSWWPLAAAIVIGLTALARWLGPKWLKGDKQGPILVALIAFLTGLGPIFQGTASLNGMFLLDVLKVFGLAIAAYVTAKKMGVIPPSTTDE